MESPTVADEAVPYQNPNRVYVMVQGVHWTLSLSHADFLSSPYRTARDTAQALRGEVMIFLTKAQSKVSRLAEIIQRLRQELRDAKQEVVMANQRVDELTRVNQELREILFRNSISITSDVETSEPT